MGIQINYYMEYASFVKLAEKAVDMGMIVLKENDITRRVDYGNASLVTKDTHCYYFYLPAAGEFRTRFVNGFERVIDNYGDGANTVIAAGYSVIDDNKKIIYGERLYSITGYYDENGVYMPRPDCIKKAYGSLERYAKKLAPTTETAYRVGEKTRVCKIYATPYCLELIDKKGYSI